MRVYEAWQDFHSHKWMYDEQSLSSLLRSVGFIDVVRRNYSECLIPNISDVEDPSRILNRAGVCLEGRKPQRCRSSSKYDSSTRYSLRFRFNA